MIKTSVIKNYFSKCEKWSSDFDYLRLKIDIVNFDIIHYFNNIVNKLDFDNSNHLISSDFDLDITYTKISLNVGKSLIASISYYGVSVPVFIIVDYNNKSFLNCWGKIDFFGSFFRLKSIGFLNNFFFSDSFLSSLSITRVDFRLDFFSNDPDFKLFDYKNFVVYSNSVVETHKTGGVINSWRVGSKLNKTVIVRGYDKKLDIQKKGKFRLFGDYQKFKNVFRLEYELGLRFCKPFVFSELDLLLDKVNKRIGLDSSFTGKMLVSYDKIDLSNEFACTRYCKVMSSYIKQALLNGINVYNFVDFELEKLGLSKKDIENFKNGSKIDILKFN